MAGEFCKERNARGRGCVLAEDHGGRCAFSSDEARALRVAHEAEMPRILQCSCLPVERYRRCPFHGDGVRAEFEPTAPIEGLDASLPPLSPTTMLGDAMEHVRKARLALRNVDDTVFARDRLEEVEADLGRLRHNAETTS